MIRTAPKEKSATPADRFKAPVLSRELSPIERITGFTLVEILIVIAMIGALSSIGIPNYLSYLSKARYTKAIADIRTLDKELQMFRATRGFYPDTLATIGRDDLLDPWGNPYAYFNISTTKYGDDDEITTEKVTGKDKKADDDEATATAKGKARKDRFLVPINTDFDLYSMGPDGKSVAPLTAKASYDDIIRASNGQYIGPASGF
jgi:general secretion pathway protein G